MMLTEFLPNIYASPILFKRAHVRRNEITIRFMFFGTPWIKDK